MLDSSNISISRISNSSSSFIGFELCVLFFIFSFVGGVWNVFNFCKFLFAFLSSVLGCTIVKDLSIFCSGNGFGVGGGGGTSLTDFLLCLINHSY